VVYDLEVEDNHNYYVESVLVHNCHGATGGDTSSKKKRTGGGTKMRQICDKCVNASWRFGLTGTLPTDPLDVRTIVAGIGPQIDEVTSKELQTKGRISDLKIVVPFISYDKTIVKERIKKYLLDMGVDENTKKEDIPLTAKFNAEKQFLENYVPRLKYIAKIVEGRLENDENILILANSLNFGKNIKKTLEYKLKDKYNSLYYVYGDIETMKRKEIRQIMEDEKKVIIIATTSLFSTGISIKNLHSVIFGNIGKSKITVLQSIGRALRQHSSKEYAKVYDLCDNLTYSARHSKERLEYYSKEEFKIKFIEITL
jgi:superfamily II DNA or RNA helicase